MGQIRIRNELVSVSGIIFIQIRNTVENNEQQLCKTVTASWILTLHSQLP
jgi:hypothetical protein